MGDDRVVEPDPLQRRTVVVGDVQAFQPLLQRVGQAVVGGAGVHPDGVAADVRQVHRPQHGAPGGHQPPGGVGVVAGLDGGRIPDPLVLGEVAGRDLVDVGELLVTGGVGVGVERPEPRGEGGVLVRRQLLVAEEHHLVLQQDGLDLVADLVGDRQPQVDPADLGADGRLQRADRQAGV